MRPLSYLFAGSSHISIQGLEILLQQRDFQCKGILTKPDKVRGRGLKKKAQPLKELAQSQKIPVWTPNSCSDSQFLKEIRDFDFCFVCAYGKILPLEFLRVFPERCLNLHFSLLPRWRGAAPIQRALMEGDSETGVSLQVMKEELDAGDIIASKSFPIDPEDNSLNLFEKSFVATKSLLEESLLPYLEGKIKTTAQDSSLSTYAKKIEKQQAQINWQESSQRIHNKVRALHLGPQAFCFLEETALRLKLYRSQINTQTPSRGFQAGEICEVEKNKLAVSCGEGVLDLLEVQKEGKKRQKIQEFLAGHPLKLKDKLY